MFRSAAALALLLPAFAAAAPVPAAKPKPVDLVLCLDVSNSMNGLIDSAKLKLWDVVNELARMKPTPTLRVALYSYGNGTYAADKGWVRKEIDLNTDLDETYAKLTALKLGGGDEYVARVTQTALADQKWSEEPGALKIIFVCGNEPADQDKQVNLTDVIGAAKSKGVLVNTIYCGPAAGNDAPGWREYATKAGGRYANIDQNQAGSEVVIATPFDQKLLDLSGKVNGTYVAYGANRRAAAEKQVAQDGAAAAAPQGKTFGGGVAAPQAALARAEAKANALYRNEAWDLVDRAKNDAKFDVKALKDDELNEDLRKLTPDQRVEYVKQKAAERTAIQNEINDLSGKRAAYVAEERKKQPKSAGELALDDALRGIIRDQAAACGFETPAKKK